MDEQGKVPRGLVIREAHFPDRAPIDSYGNGGFRFAEMSHRGSILCVPSGIYGWSPAVPDDLTRNAFARVLEEADLIELLLVGTGSTLVPLNEGLHRELQDMGVRYETMGTGPAVRTFNILLSEGRPVAGAFLAVD